MSKYEKRVVAYIDILGFKNMVDASKESDEECERLTGVLHYISDIVKEYENDREYIDVEATMFSDSIVISYKVCNRYPDVLYYLLEDLWHIQIDLIEKYKLFLRGGVTIGDLYHKGAIIFGPAMNQAYKLESEVADYMRIIIDQKSIDDFENRHPEYNDSEQDTDMKILRRYIRNEISSLDILNLPENFTTINGYVTFLKAVKKIIVDNLTHCHNSSNSSNNRVFQKYSKLKDYFNDILCKQKLKSLSEQEYIDLHIA